MPKGLSLTADRGNLSPTLALRFAHLPQVYDWANQAVVLAYPPGFSLLNKPKVVDPAMLEPYPNPKLPAMGNNPLAAVQVSQASGAKLHVNVVHGVRQHTEKAGSDDLKAGSRPRRCGEEEGIAGAATPCLRCMLLTVCVVASWLPVQDVHSQGQGRMPGGMVLTGVPVVSLAVKCSRHVVSRRKVQGCQRPAASLQWEKHQSPLTAVCDRFPCRHQLRDTMRLEL